MKNLVNIIFEPSQTFQHIKEKDDWWIPFTLLVIVSLGFLWISSPAMTRLTAQKMAEMGIDRELPKAMEYVKYISVPITTFLGFLLASLLIWFLGNSFGADWNFIKALDLYSYSSVVHVIRSVLNIVVLSIRGIPNITTFRDLNIATGLNLFFSPENPKLYALFSGIEIFAIWQFILIAYGISEITGIPKKKAAVISAISFLITIGFSVIFAGKGSM